MTHIFPREAETWAAGDLAYCVRGSRNSVPPLERGRVYRVTEARKPENIVHHGLRLEGFALGEYWGFCSNRFIKLGPIGGRLQRIAAATEYSPMHYWPSCVQPSRDRSAKRRDVKQARPAGRERE